MAQDLKAFTGAMLNDLNIWFGIHTPKTPFWSRKSFTSIFPLLVFLVVVTDLQAPARAYQQAAAPLATHQSRKTTCHFKSFRGQDLQGYDLLLFLSHQKGKHRTKRLSPSFRPCDLEPVTQYTQARHALLRRVALKAFYRLQRAAHAQGVDDILLVSGYRNYYRQAWLYRKSLKTKGVEYTSKNLALPGYSEHQLGTTIDISTVGSRKAEPGGLANPAHYNWKKDPSYKWLYQNAHRFGFVLSYPKSYNLGYNFEPWHFRYLGVKTARRIRRRGVSTQHYLAGYAKMKRTRSRLASRHEKLASKHERLASRHKRLASRYQRLASRHKKLASRHEKLASRHERLASRHEKLASRHKKGKRKNVKRKSRAPASKSASRHTSRTSPTSA